MNFNLAETTTNPMSIREDLNEFLAAFPNGDGFNLTAFQQLAEDTDEDTTLRILARFWQNLQETLADVDPESIHEHYGRMQRLAHRVAGTAELLGFQMLGQMARELDRQLKTDPSAPNVKEGLMAFIQVSLRLIKDIQKSFPNLQVYLLPV